MSEEIAGVRELESLAGLAGSVVSASMATVIPDLAHEDPLVRRSDHADFQSNVALALAKRANLPPRELAANLQREVDVEGLHVELSGPGFLNINFTDERLWTQMRDRSGLLPFKPSPSISGPTTVIDYSSPNIAKEMHVGHLRASIIGDALVRILAFLGHRVIRQNHVGDWGTQFGMLIQYLVERGDDVVTAHRPQAGDGELSALDRLYREARHKFDTDTEFAERARQRVSALQSGDPVTIEHWSNIVKRSERAFQQIYDRLDVLLRPEDYVGESFYNPVLPEITDELLRAGVAVEDAGAICVYFDDVSGPDGSPVPLIVRKADGGFGYAATDLAALRHRIFNLKARRLLYVVDARQALHFKMLFATARRIGWLSDDVEAIHVGFGTVLGPDGRPFKTRSGGTVRLGDLLDWAAEKVRAEIDEKSHGLDQDELNTVVEQAGIAAVKYADLSISRTKDYVFDLDRMVSFDGNTGVYLQYAHARLRSILRNAGSDGAFPAVSVQAKLHPAERALILLLDEFEGLLGEVAGSLEPHRLCGYLFSVAKAFTGFYDTCPVLKAETDELRNNRLALCHLTGETLACGLNLLGIAAPERM